MSLHKEFGYQVPCLIIQPNLRTMNEYYVKEDYETVIQGEHIFIEKGFSYDGASIPWPLWPILGHPMHPRLCTAAGIHDKGYRGVLPRDVADLMFYNVLLDHGYPKCKAKIAYLGVRLFGGFYYRG